MILPRKWVGGCRKILVFIQERTKQRKIQKQFCSSKINKKLHNRAAILLRFRTGDLLEGKNLEDATRKENSSGCFQESRLGIWQKKICTITEPHTVVPDYWQCTKNALWSVLDCCVWLKHLKSSPPVELDLRTTHSWWNYLSFGSSALVHVQSRLLPLGWKLLSCGSGALTHGQSRPL